MVEHYGGDVWVEDRADSHLGGVRPTADASTDGGPDGLRAGGSADDGGRSADESGGATDEPRGTVVVIELPVAGATATSAADD
jgi:signal transduction histidine kinase